MTLKQLWELEQLLKQNSETAAKLLKHLNTIKSITPCEETDKHVKDVKLQSKPKESQDTQMPAEV